MLQVVSFAIGRETFGVPIAVVHEIVRVPEITVVPDAPDHVEGVMNLRGRIVPVVDLRKRFGEKQIVASKRNRVLVAEVEKRTVGLVVDATAEILKLEQGQIEPLPADILQDDTGSYLSGVGRIGDRLVILVDLKRVLAPRSN